MLQLFQSLRYPFQLPNLLYDYASLEPHIDAQTMEIHYSKHHATYVNKLNQALENHPPLHQLSLYHLLSDPLQVPDPIRQAVINHGGGHANHTLFWQIMGSPKPSTPTTDASSSPSPSVNQPQSPLSDAINQTFTNFETFQKQFSDAAASVFGSGWAWLAINQQMKLQILTTSNQDSPLAQNLTPILTLDVWEHAYYLKYQNRRPDYIAAWWNTINWGKVGELYQEITS
jgi:Fe-Mn family superoxide dismutase